MLFPGKSTYDISQKIVLYDFRFIHIASKLSNIHWSLFLVSNEVSFGGSWFQENSVIGNVFSDVNCADTILKDYYDWCQKKVSASVLIRLLSPIHIDLFGLSVTNQSTLTILATVFHPRYINEVMSTADSNVLRYKLRNSPLQTKFVFQSYWLSI